MGKLVALFIQNKSIYNINISLSYNKKLFHLVEQKQIRNVVEILPQSSTISVFLPNKLEAANQEFTWDWEPITDVEEYESSTFLKVLRMPGKAISFVYDTSLLVYNTTKAAASAVYSAIKNAYSWTTGLFYSVFGRD